MNLSGYEMRSVEKKFPILVPDYRFDQKNEMFKRRIWDKDFIEPGKRLYSEVKYQNRYGYRKLDYALRNASWSLEHGFGFGNMKSNHGLYSWTHISEKIKRFVETDGPVELSLEENTRIVKKAARFLGADLVGICYSHPNLVYSHEFDLLEMEHRKIELPENCTNAIIMAVEMNYDSSRYSPDGISGASTGLGYSMQAVLANLLAVFIRGLGYQAVPSGNDTALSVPLSIAAGLGEMGRMGLLITKKYGPRVRLCKVFTDLPLHYDDPTLFGVERFCQTCKKCADHCPSKAISYEDKTNEGPSISNFSGVRKWYIDPERCFLFWNKNWMDCNNCIRACPFNKPHGLLHDTVRFSIKQLPVFNRFMILMDDLLGYGRSLSSSEKDFWEV